MLLVSHLKEYAHISRVFVVSCPDIPVSKVNIWGRQYISNLTNSIVHGGCVPTSQILGVEIDHHQTALQSLQTEILCISVPEVLRHSYFS
jgi:hypothetical protein